MRQIAELPKANVKSTQYAKNKLEKDLRLALEQIDTTKDGMLTFDMLGRFLHFLRIYKILYNPEFHLHCRPDGEFATKVKGAVSRGFQTRKDQELEFHINLWRLLKRRKGECIDAVVLLELLILFSDSGYESVGELAAYTEGKVGVKIVIELLRAAEKGYGEVESEAETSGMKWTCEQLIKSYKGLNAAPLLIPKAKIERMQSFSFNPKINPKSRAIAERSKCEFNMCRTCKSPTRTEDIDFDISSNNMDTRVAMMYEKHREIEEKREKMRMKQMEEEVKECTFHPVLCSSRVMRRCTSSANVRDSASLTGR